MRVVAKFTDFLTGEVREEVRDINLDEVVAHNALLQRLAKRRDKAEQAGDDRRI